MMSATATDRSGHWVPVLLYLCLVVYASLFPFAGWRDQGLDGWSFMFAPWPRYWTGFDVAINLVGYVPLGLLLGLSLRARWSWPWTVLGAWLLCALVSFAMESLQRFVPSRVPSNVDWLLNTLGAGLGIAVAWGLEQVGWLQRLRRLRSLWLAPQARVEVYLLGVWPLALLFPTSVSLGLGQITEPMHRYLLNRHPESFWVDWLPELGMWEGVALSPAAELVVVVVGLWLPMLLAIVAVQGRWHKICAVLAVAALGWVACTLCATLSFGPAHAWVWWSQVTQLGWMLAVGLGVACCAVTRRSAWALGLMAGVCGLALVNQLSGNAYLAYNLVAWEQGQFARFHGLAQWLGLLWPYAALIHMFFRLIHE